MADNDAYLWDIFPDEAFPEEQWPLFGDTIQYPVVTLSAQTMDFRISAGTRQFSFSADDSSYS